MCNDSRSQAVRHDLVKQALFECRQMRLGFCRSEGIQNLTEWDGRAFELYRKYGGKLNAVESFAQMFKAPRGKRRVQKTSLEALMRVFLEAGDLDDTKISAIKNVLRQYGKSYSEDISHIVEYVDQSIDSQTRYHLNIDSIESHISGNTGTIIDLWSDDVGFGNGLAFGIDVMFDSVGDESSPRLKRLRIEVTEPNWRWDMFYNFRQAEPARVGQCKIKSVGVLSKPGWHLEPFDAACFEAGNVHIVPAATRLRAEVGAKVKVVAIACPLDYHQHGDLSEMDISEEQRAIIAHMDAKEAGDGCIAAAWAQVSYSYMGCRR